MSAAISMPASAEADVCTALLMALKADEVIIAAFGEPARIVDGDAPAPAYPFVRLERHETEPAGASCFNGQDHRITLSIASRYGGRSDAKRLVGIVREAAETATLTVQDQNVVLVRAVYSDVLRAADLTQFRGLLRIRIITEEAA